jgi:hypothetical protein
MYVYMALCPREDKKLLLTEFWTLDPTNGSKSSNHSSVFSVDPCSHMTKRTWVASLCQRHIARFSVTWSPTLRSWEIYCTDSIQWSRDFCYSVNLVACLIHRKQNVDISQALCFAFRQMKGNETHKRDFSNYFVLSKTIQKKGKGALRLQKRRTAFAVD